MATYNFSALSNGQAITFNPNSDVLNFDQTAISAGNLAIDLQGSDTRVTVLSGTDAGKSITLLSALPTQLASSNVHFANGSGIFFGDNSSGTAGDDLGNSLDGTNGNDLVKGFGGNDTIFANAGNDRIESGAGNDTISGGGGQDQYVWHEYGAANADTVLNFDTGWDSIQLDAAAFTQIGATGQFAANDVRFYAAAGANAGHDADDRIIYNTTTSQLWYDADGNGPGAAQLIATLPAGATVVASDINVFGNAAPPPPPPGTINGTAGDDSLTGTPGNDTINGFGGNDTINGLDGNDSLDGGAGNDSVIGGAGRDMLVGGDGNDTLDGTSPNLTGPGEAQEADTLSGGLGDDLYIVGANDVILADPGGVDTVRAMGTSWTLGQGLDNLILQQVGPQFDGASGTGNELDNLIDGSGYDHAGTLSGLGGNDTLFSGQNSGTLLGGDGNDLLKSASSPHGITMDGGPGNDTLTGGGTGDVYIFDAQPGAANADLITTFASGFATIRLDATVMGALGPSGTFSPNDSRFYAAPGASSGHDSDDRVVYDTSTGNLWYDADGVGSGAAQLIATLQGAPALAATDITVLNGSAGSTINGTSGNDLLVGGTGNDTINGFGGNDTLVGDSGDDVLNGGDGDDLIYLATWSNAAYGHDTVDGGTGNDTLLFAYQGPTSANSTSGIVVDLQAGTLSGGGRFGTENAMLANIENVGGTQFADRIAGDAGNNTLTGFDGDDTLIGGAGADFLDGSNGNDSLIGGDGNDSLGGGLGADTLDGGLGDDWFYADASDTLVDAGGVDSVSTAGSWTLATGFENLYLSDGPSGTQTGIGNAADNYMFTGSMTQSASLSGLEGNDSLFGGDMGDMLDGGAGNDSITGGTGNDSITGGPGRDMLVGGDGNDTVDAFDPKPGTAEADTLSGGAGNDFYIVDSADVIVADSGGMDTVRAVDTDWTLGDGLDNLILGQTASGTGHQNGTGNGLDNVIDSSGLEFGGTLSGLGGNDTLIGGQKGGTLVGGDGNDVLRSSAAPRTHSIVMDGGAGNDTLTGSGSGDTYVFDVQPGTANADVMTAFFPNIDTIQLDASVMGALGAAGRMSAGDSRFSAGPGEFSGNTVLHYDTTTGNLWYVPDPASHFSAFELIATLSGAPALSATDITVIGQSARTIVGTSGNDSLTGADGNDTIQGLGGDDTLDGGSGNDSLDGGQGNDSLRGGQGADSLIGGDGNDTLDASGLSGGDGVADTLDGGLGDDVYLVNNDGDIILPDPGGIDTVRVTNGSWTLGAGLENLDLVDNVGAAFSGTGNELNNTILSASEGGTLSGMGGDDLLIARNAQNTVGLDGGDGNDTLDGSGWHTNMFAGAGDDVLISGGGADTMAGGAGADTFRFTFSASAVVSDFASGTDKLSFDGKAFTAIGASGNFSAGDARFFAGTAAHDADDRIIFDGATGNLWYDSDGNGAGSAVLIAQVTGNVIATDIAVINGTSGGGNPPPPPPGSIVGTDGNDDLAGTTGNDTIYGMGGNDFLAGSSGADSIVGGAGNDTIYGDADNDWLEGSTGNDSISGGGGQDSIVFREFGGANADSVGNFSGGWDNLRFDHNGFTQIGAVGHFASGDARFYAAAGASGGHDADDRLIYNTSTGQLYYDADGSGAGAPELVATLQGAPSIAPTDIWVI